MTLSLILGQQILSLLIIVFVGFTAKKMKIVPDNASQVLASLLLYVIAPCTVFDSFQINYTPERLFGLVVGLMAALAAMALFLILNVVFKKIFRLSKVEQGSVIYANTGNLIIPLVSSVLGPEYVIYTSAYNSLQTIFLWTHAYTLITGDEKVKLKKILLNPNIIAMILGILFFLLPIPMPEIIGTSISKIGGTIGPISMINIGLIMGNSNLLDVLKGKRIYLISFLRLLFLPICLILVIRLTGITYLMPETQTILMISLLAAAAPIASTIPQFAEIAQNESVNAGKMNIMSTLLCIVTMPLIVMFYQLLCM